MASPEGTEELKLHSITTETVTWCSCFRESVGETPTAIDTRSIRTSTSGLWLCTLEAEVMFWRQCPWSMNGGPGHKRPSCAQMMKGQSSLYVWLVGEWIDAISSCPRQSSHRDINHNPTASRILQSLLPEECRMDCDNVARPEATAHAVNSGAQLPSEVANNSHRSRSCSHRACPQPITDQEGIFGDLPFCVG